ncbi:FAD-dependent oxidoreductase [Pseudomonas sp. GD03860]|uniref:NAD(P)/FAD-dependent oxidoreductase n=1 Tax=Pseudomonas TaxID=286 RepID=UPI002363EFA9|nr:MULTISPECIES: FAD-dependent oxidoreductase [Pseudomonas]MDD2058399.1 FAD-dependent oxidoreductase [Pseudomonas putida]MDH0640211.1 FAD-dependent oxidoreductase [Pseudomonas sp. GD03860]
MSKSIKLCDVLIVGGGQAAAQTAFALRQQGFAGSVVLVSDEPVLPYQRPPLSKQFLRGEVSLESLQLWPAAAYEQGRIECMLGTTVVRLLPDLHQVELQGGQRLGYGKLVLATGGRARRLTLPGAELAGVEVLRTQQDVLAIRDGWQAEQRLVIVGGGYVGLEVAAVARGCGHIVTVLEQAERVLARVTAPQLSQFYEKLHRGHGVEVLTNAAVVGFQADALGKNVAAVVLTDGRVIPADRVIVGVGLIPNTELAEQAGLALENGIRVDAFCKTSDPDIYAAGDCANYPCGFFGRRMRLESVPNANEHARCIAANLCGQNQQLQALPWFWSDQYGLKLQMAGLSEGHDQFVLRGSLADGQFSAFYLKGGQLIAVDCVGRPAEFMQARRLIQQRVPVQAEQLADECVGLKGLA